MRPMVSIFEENELVTSYPDAATGLPQPAPVAAPSRPGVLLGLVAVAVVSALASIVDGVLFFVGGRDMALDVAADTIAAITGASADYGEGRRAARRWRRPLDGKAGDAARWMRAASSSARCCCSGGCWRERLLGSARCCCSGAR